MTGQLEAHHLVIVGHIGDNDVVVEVLVNLVIEQLQREQLRETNEISRLQEVGLYTYVFRISAHPATQQSSDVLERRVAVHLDRDLRYSERPSAQVPIWSYLHVWLFKVPRDVVKGVPPHLLDRQRKREVHERVERD